MPKGPGTYGFQVGRPKKRKKVTKMNEQELEELAGKSIWNTYRSMAHLISEVAITPPSGKTTEVTAQQARNKDHVTKKSK